MKIHALTLYSRFHFLCIAMVLTAFNLAIAQSVTTNARSKLLDKPGHSKFAVIMPGVELDYLQTKRHYTEVRLRGIVALANLRSPVEEDSPSMTIKKCDIFSSLGTSPIAQLNRSTHLEVLDKYQEYAEVTLTGWIPSRVLRVTDRNVTYNAPLEPRILSEAEYLQMKTAGSVDFALGIAIAASGIVSLVGAGDANARVNSTDGLIAYYRETFNEVPGSLIRQRDDYASTRTKYYIVSGTFFIAGAVLAIYGQGKIDYAEKHKPIGNIEPVIMGHRGAGLRLTVNLK